MIRQKLDAVGFELTEFSFSHVFRSASMDFHRIANRRPRGESTRNCAPFSYTSLYGVINCQILNGPGSFNGVCQEK